MKCCNKCKIQKELDDFSKNKRNKDGLNHYCKSCSSNIRKENYILNKDKISKKRRNKYSENIEQSREKKRNYYHLNKERILESQKEYLNNNIEYKERYNQYQREYHKSEKYKEYKLQNSEKIKLYDKEYRQRPEIKERINKQKVERAKNRKIQDPLYKLTVSIRSSISNNFRCNGFKKSKKTKEILGCSFEDFKIYLESKFEHWMNWDNKGLYNGEFEYGWDIDHIIPLQTASCEEDIVRLNHYSNLQPLCSKLNREIKRENYEMSI
jgi:hypothetical protein